MSEQPISGSALRGAVDLSGLSRQQAGGSQGRASRSGAAGSAGEPGAAGGASGTVVEATDANFGSIVNSSMRYPLVVVLWSPRLRESAEFVDTLAAVARSYQGRFQLATIDIDANPGVQRAFQAQSVPVTIGLLQGQPVPLFGGVQPEEQVRAYVDELLNVAVANGVTGRVEAPEADQPDDAEEPQEEPLSPLHEEAYHAIERGDLGAAASAYEQAIAADPADTDARLGLAQVHLMQRTAGLDPAAARQAAADNPTDVPAQLVAADLDILGGHVEDAFARLVGLVRVTAGEERDAARAHLLELFEVVGSGDERVRKARTALMSALF